MRRLRAASLLKAALKGKAELYGTAHASHCAPPMAVLGVPGCAVQLSGQLPWTSLAHSCRWHDGPATIQPTRGHSSCSSSSSQPPHSNPSLSWTTNYSAAQTSSQKGSAAQLPAQEDGLASLQDMVCSAASSADAAAPRLALDAVAEYFVGQATTHDRSAQLRRKEDQERLEEIMATLDRLLRDLNKWDLQMLHRCNSLASNARVPAVVRDHAMSFLSKAVRVIIRHIRHSAMEFSSFSDERGNSSSFSDERGNRATALVARALYTLSCSKAPLVHGMVVKQTLGYLRAVVGQMGSKDAWKVAVALPKLGQPFRLYFQSASAHFLGHSDYCDGSRLMELTPKQLAFLALAYADAGVRDKPLLLGISEALSRKSDHVKGQDIAMVTSALAMLHVPSPSIMHTLAALVDHLCSAQLASRTSSSTNGFSIGSTGSASSSTNLSSAGSNGSSSDGATPQSSTDASRTSSSTNDSLSSIGSTSSVSSNDVSSADYTAISSGGSAGSASSTMNSSTVHSSSMAPQSRLALSDLTDIARKCLNLRSTCARPLAAATCNASVALLQQELQAPLQQQDHNHLHLRHHNHSQHLHHHQHQQQQQQQQQRQWQGDSAEMGSHSKPHQQLWQGDSARIGSNTEGPPYQLRLAPNRLEPQQTIILLSTCVYFRIANPLLLAHGVRTFQDTPAPVLQQQCGVTPVVHLLWSLAKSTASASRQMYLSSQAAQLVETLLQWLRASHAHLGPSLACTALQALASLRVRDHTLINLVLHSNMPTAADQLKGSTPRSASSAAALEGSTPGSASNAKGMRAQEAHAKGFSDAATATAPGLHAAGAEADVCHDSKLHGSAHLSSSSSSSSSSDTAMRHVEGQIGGKEGSFESCIGSAGAESEHGCGHSQVSTDGAVHGPSGTVHTGGSDGGAESALGREHPQLCSVGAAHGPSGTASTGSDSSTTRGVDHGISESGSTESLHHGREREGSEHSTCIKKGEGEEGVTASTSQRDRDTSSRSKSGHGKYISGRGGESERAARIAARMLCALAELQHDDQDAAQWLAALALKGPPHQPHYHPYQLSSLAQSLAQLHVMDPAVWQHLVASVARSTRGPHAMKWRPRKLAPMMWALGEAYPGDGVAHVPDWDCAVRGVLEAVEAQLPHLTARQLLVVMHGCARVRCALPALPVMDHLALQASRCVAQGQYNLDELLVLLWSSVVVGHGSHVLYDALAEALLPRVGELQLGGATLAAWCYLRHANYLHPTLIKRLLHHCTELLNHSSGQPAAGKGQHQGDDDGVHGHADSCVSAVDNGQSQLHHQQQQSAQDCTPVLLLTLTASFASCKGAFPATSALFSSIAARASAMRHAALAAQYPLAPAGSVVDAASLTGGPANTSASEGTGGNTSSTSLSSSSSSSSSRPIDVTEHEALMQLLSILSHSMNEPAPALSPKRVATVGESSSSDGLCNGSSPSAPPGTKQPVAYPALPLSLRLTPTYHEGSKLDWEWGRKP